jgi:hypothetical protein
MIRERRVVHVAIHDDDLLVRAGLGQRVTERFACSRTVF